MSRVRGVGSTSSGIIAAAPANTVMKLMAVRTVPSIGVVAMTTRQCRSPHLRANDK